MNHLSSHRVLWALIVFFSSISNGLFADTRAAISHNLPSDSLVVHRTLANGFSYYIRHNEEPKNRVTIYLVNKVGSVLETENQRGLAHFLEHMAFNGTKHFPKNEMISYLQKSGVKFGSDLNAYTTFDETVYQLPLPTDNPELLRNGFLIMRDWAHEANLDPLEIDKERGVILEEKRLHAGAQERIQEKTMPILANQSIYAERMPIGTEEVLLNCTRETMAGFYKWYRPNLQAIIVVGDIDVAATEKTIRDLFSDLKNPVGAPERKNYSIDLKGKNQYLTATDKELQFPAIQVFNKFYKEPLITDTDIKRSIALSILNQVISERMSDLARKSDSPFLQADAGVGELIANLSSFSTTVVAEPDKIEPAFKTVWNEIARLKKYGITPQELQRGVQSYLQNLETMYREKDKVSSENYVEEYMRNFLYNEAFPGMEYTYTVCSNMVKNMTTEDVNQLLNTYLTDFNRDIIITAPDKDQSVLPDEKTINSWMKQIEDTVQNVYAEDVAEAQLLTTIPQAGKIIKTKTDKAIGTTTLFLSNGAKVIIKPTNLKNDEIVFSAFSPGGTSLYSDTDYQSATVAANVVASAGLGTLNPGQFEKYMSGKNFAVMPYINESFEGFKGNSTPGELETALQAMYSYFTQPRKDFTTIQKDIERTKSSLLVPKSNPNSVFSDSIAAILSNYNKRRTALTIDKVNQIDLERTFAIYKERFADASDFTFTFVGNIDIEKFKPLVEEYIASLPAINRKEKAKDLGIHIPAGKIDKSVFKGLEPKSSVLLVFSGNYHYSEKSNQQLDALASLLTIKLTEKLREQESGVYGVSASASHSKYPVSRFAMMIQFGCSPANVDKLTALALEIVKEVKSELPNQEDIQKVVSEDLRAREVQLQSNRFWLSYLTSQMQNNESVDTILSYKAEEKTVTPNTLRAIARQYLSGNNFAKIVLYPEK